MQIEAAKDQARVEGRDFDRNTVWHLVSDVNRGSAAGADAARRMAQLAYEMEGALVKAAEDEEVQRHAHAACWAARLAPDAVRSLHTFALDAAPDAWRVLGRAPKMSVH
jgi:hypothetical protein